jgi:hypothetical protein
MSLISKIQKKSQKEKLAIMWTIGIIVAIILIVIWVISAHYQKNVVEDTSLFQTIGQGFHNLKSNYKK